MEGKVRMPDSQLSRWFGRHERNPAARVTLFCLPFSGSGASAYNSWKRLFPPEVEVCPVHLPGRDERLNEDPDLSPASVARVLAERIDLPFAVYGHSMGARLGFEVLRSLRDCGRPAPLRCYAAASPPPDVADAFPACVELPDDAFLEFLIQTIDAPSSLRDEPELREIFLPLLRHDLRWCRDYRYDAGLPLDTTVVALAGRSDVTASPEVMAGWSRHGDQFRMLTLAGGHFFLKTAESELTTWLAQDLLGALAEPGPHGHAASPAR
jgi:surfactin synthase thioesterase subunit